MSSLDRDASVTQSVDLIHDAQGGDLQALDRLFARYYERVRRIVRIRIGPKLRTAVEVEDILQETFVAAVQGFQRFEVRNQASLINWLSTIAEHKIQNAAGHMRAAKRDRAREVALKHVRDSMESGELVLEPAADILQPLEELAESEQVQLIEECMQELKPSYREVILHRDYAGASWEEVAELMEAKSANAVRMLHARALVELATRTRRRTKG